MLRKLIVIITSVLLGCAISTLAFAGVIGTYNSQGVSGAALTVGTSATKVIPFVVGRSDVYIFNGTTNVLYCEAGPTGVTPAGQAPSPSPTSAGANAFPIQSNNSVHFSVNGSYTPTGIGLIAQSEIDCACSAASCTVNTWELP